MWWRVNAARAPRQLARAPGRSLLALAQGRAAPALPAGRPVRRLQAGSDYAGAPNCGSAELPAKMRHPKRCPCDARRPSPCSGALCRRCACRAGRSFSSREGERNRPRGERRGFFLGITSEADWALRAGSPARVPALYAFIQLVVHPPRPILTAGSSPPFPRATETSGGPDAQVSRQTRYWLGRPRPHPLRKRSRPAVSLPTGLRAAPASPRDLAAPPGALDTALTLSARGARWVEGVAVTPIQLGWRGAEDVVLS